MCQGRRATTRCLQERCTYIYAYICIYIYIYIYKEGARGVRTEAGLPLLAGRRKGVCIYSYYIYIREAYVPRQACHYFLPVGKVSIYLYIYMYIYIRKERQRRTCRGRLATTHYPSERCVYIFIQIDRQIQLDRQIYIYIKKEREAYVPRQAYLYSLSC